jgi:hypothetical protein
MKSFTLLPSVDRLLSGAASAAKRFPLALLCATAGAISAVILTDRHQLEAPDPLMNLVAAMSLGLPLFISLVTMSERYRWPKTWHWLSQAIGVVALTGYFFSLPDDLFHPTHYAIRHVILLFWLHFLVAVGPFLNKVAGRAFWQYNISVLLSFLTSAFYSAALFVGLTIALAAADYLFGFDVKGDTYAELWMLMAGIINTWIFLALVPSDYEALETSDEYPGGLKIFSQYVLLPLVGLYFVILFAYELKIIFEWNWPKGWVSQMVLWYAVVGALALLLLHPLREREGNRWIGRFGDWYYRLMIPLAVMLFLAIRRRIADYGVTEPRYLVLGLAIGLSIVVLYFLLSRRKDIRIIPIVLVCLAALAAYGPLSASSVSTWSQTSRLDQLLVKHGLLKDSVLQIPEAEIPLEARREMSSVVAYLNESRGPEVFARWLPDSTVQSAEKMSQSEETRYSINDTVARHLGFEFNWSPYYGAEGKYVSMWVEEPRILDIAGFEKLLSFELNSSEQRADSANAYSSNDFSCRAGLLPKSSIALITFTLRGDTTHWEIPLDVAPRVEELYEMNNPREIPQDSLTFDRSVGAFDTRIFVRSLHGEKRDGKLELNSLRAQILVRMRQ